MADLQEPNCSTEQCTFHITFNLDGSLMANVMAGSHALSEDVWTRSNVLKEIVEAERGSREVRSEVQVPFSLQAILNWVWLRPSNNSKPQTLCNILNVRSSPHCLSPADIHLDPLCS